MNKNLTKKELALLEKHKFVVKYDENANLPLFIQPRIVCNLEKCLRQELCSNTERIEIDKIRYKEAYFPYSKNYLKSIRNKIIFTTVQLVVNELENLVTSCARTEANSISIPVSIRVCAEGLYDIAVQNIIKEYKGEFEDLTYIYGQIYVSKHIEFREDFLDEVPEEEITRRFKAAVEFSLRNIKKICKPILKQKLSKTQIRKIRQHFDDNFLGKSVDMTPTINNIINCEKVLIYSYFREQFYQFFSLDVKSKFWDRIGFSCVDDFEWIYWVSNNLHWFPQHVKDYTIGGSK